MEKQVGIKVTVVLDRTLYINEINNESEKELLERAKKEIILPIDAMNTVKQLFQKSGIDIKKLDLSDWDIQNINYDIIK